MESEQQIGITKDESQILLDALEDLLYKLAMQMDQLKGGPMNAERISIDRKQKIAESLQHKISLIQ